MAFATDEERRAYNRWKCYRHRERHPESVKESNDRNYRKHRDKIKRAAKKYYYANIESRKVYSKEYRERNGIMLVERMRDYNAKSTAERNKLKDCGCLICGYNKCKSALEFHHMNPEEKINHVGSIKSKKAMRDEASKCIVLCSNCHRELHENIKFDTLTDAQMIALTS